MRTGAACEGGALPLEAEGVKHCTTHGSHLENCTDYCREQLADRDQPCRSARDGGPCAHDVGTQACFWCGRVSPNIASVLEGNNPGRCIGGGGRLPPSSAGVRGIPMAKDFICGGCDQIFPMAQARIRFDAMDGEGKLHFQAEPLPFDQWRFVAGFWCEGCVHQRLPIRLLTDEAIRKWHDSAQAGDGTDRVTMRSRIMLLCQELSRERAVTRETRQMPDVG